MYPTPLGEPYGSSQNGSNSDRPSAGTPSLETWARSWMTPSASAAKGARHWKRGEDNPELLAQAEDWPTPQAQNFRGRGGDRIDEEGLDRMAKNWETPRASEADRGACPVEMERRSPGLKAQASLFPTPRAYSFDESHAPGQTSLDVFAKAMFPTATGRDAGSSGCAHLGTESGRHTGRTLTDVASGRGVGAGPWTTPTSRDSRGPSSKSRREDVGRPTANLADQVSERWSTPEAHNAKGCRGEGCAVQEDLGRQATSRFGLQAPGSPTSGATSSDEGPTSAPPSRSGTTARRLNPRFVEWLMGVPFSWSETTASACSETEWCRWWRLALCFTCWLAP